MVFDDVPMEAAVRELLLDDRARACRSGRSRSSTWASTRPILRSMIMDENHGQGVAWALFLVLVVIFTCVIVFRVQQKTISRTALGVFFLIGTRLLDAALGGRLPVVAASGAVLGCTCGSTSCFADVEKGPRNLEATVPAPARPQLRDQGGVRHAAKRGWTALSRRCTWRRSTSSSLVIEENLIPQMREALLACEAEGIEAWVSADFIQTLVHARAVRPIRGAAAADLPDGADDFVGAGRQAGHRCGGVVSGAGGGVARWHP